MTAPEIIAGELESIDLTKEISLDKLRFPINTANHVKLMMPQVLAGNFENFSFPVDDWQKSQLESLDEPGVRCLLNMWFTNPKEEMGETYCNATWDNVYCWPQTPSVSIVSRPCSEILHDSEPGIAHRIQGSAVRICLNNGTWLWDKWTNYTECADSYDEYFKNAEKDRKLVVVVQYILFVGSILSIMCLAIALLIFYYFKCLRCDRVTVHVHLMLALLLRFSLLIVLTEPFIFNRKSHYRHVDLICKVVLSLNLYSTVASVNWMFVQGLYLHGKLTTNVFDKEASFKVYYLIGWIFPLGLIIAYATVLETYHPVHCWKNYSERSDIWILLGPMLCALLINLLFLINIMRILLTKVERPSPLSDSAQFRRAVKATLVLFPLLGINNLLFLYNPGGEYHKYFVIFNAIFGSTQGISVSILYCFVHKDVRNAIRRLFHRYTVRRGANAMRVNYSRGSSVVRQTISPSRSHHLIRRESSKCLKYGRRMCGTTSTPELAVLHQILSNTSSLPFSFGNWQRRSYSCSPFLHSNSALLGTSKKEAVSV